MRILVANRGEIAARIVRTITDLSMTSIAVYADQDLDSPGVKLANEAHSLTGSTLSDTYMNADKILDIAASTGATMVHPGYGFLSENADFARAVTEAGLTWIGPSAETIAMLGDKIAARRTATAAGVPLIPGTTDPLTDIDELRTFASNHGFPVAAKRSDGGGGRGITILRSEKDVDEFAARYGSDLSPYFLEKFIEKARHVETQAMRDAHGNFAIVSTRDCSVQRRNQKVIEEAPAVGLSEAVMAGLEQSSRALFEAADYIGLGTCEFLVDGDGYYFLEVNPRLQVEHTVSEEVTGLDLVEQQIRIALGEAMSEVPPVRGHSIELRITSEDPGLDLMPTAGTISSLAWPFGHGVRIDTSVGAGDTVTPDFDSMIAKIIVTGPSRQRAIARCRRVLAELAITGIATPVAILDQILAHEAFGSMSVYTKWMEEEFLPSADIPAPTTSEVAEAEEMRTFTAVVDGRRHSVTVPAGLLAVPLPTMKKPQPRRGTQRTKEGPGIAAVSADGVITSPIQAIVVSVPVEVGQEVAEGEVLMVLEAMKMEKYIHATASGTVESISVSPGDNVVAGAQLIKVVS